MSSDEPCTSVLLDLHFFGVLENENSEWPQSTYAGGIAGNRPVFHVFVSVHCSPSGQMVGLEVMSTGTG